MKKKFTKPIDRFLSKRLRGRPVRIRPSEVLGRAGHFHFIFDQVWDQLWPLLSQARNVAEVTEAFERCAAPYHEQFVPLMTGLVLKVLREPRFPKRRSTQVSFFADSLAGIGVVTPRRSRDICVEEKKREKGTHHIISYEFLIECSCGHRGQSRDHACPHCGAKIEFGFDLAPISTFTG